MTPGALASTRRLRLPSFFVLLAAVFPAAGEDGAAPFGPAPMARSRLGVVSSTVVSASRAGAAVLAEGGNAVDAAVATAFALAVTYPQAGNLAGGGFAVVRTAEGRFFALDFRETAPSETWERTFLNPDGTPRAGGALQGGLAVATPGTVRGLEELHAKLGKLPWRRLVEPALRLAREGFAVPPMLEADLALQSQRLKKSPETRRLFFPGGAPLRAGTLFSQPDLASTLEAIAAGGAAAFHGGAIARRISERVRETGGVLSTDDLADYAPVWRAPFEVAFGRFRLVTMPPPSSGGVLLMSILGQLEAATGDLASLPVEARIHVVAEAERRAYADRNEFASDPDCVPMPLARLLAPARLAALGASIHPRRATPSSAIRAGGVPDGGPSTTHLSVAAATGEAVALTYTLNDSFGNGDVVPGVGVLLNNEMDDFTVHPGRPNLFGLVQGTSNAVRAGARPVSSITPTIVLEDGKPRWVLGSPGGSTIPTSVLQVFLNAGPLGLPLRDAVSAVRFHHQHLPDRIEVERGVFPEALAVALRARGHVVEERRRTSTWGRLGAVHAAGFERDGSVVGVTDPRRSGAPATAEEASRSGPR